ncbi:MAG: thiamine phosphate synthase [Gemmatimonadetes bacterium]|nr:thiamine phosphate synthase [Gemmatimonadota bacterium]
MRTLPRLVAVTDDRRLEADDFPERLEALLGAGLPAVWLRAKELPAGEFYARALLARAATKAYGVELWIGDRADVAALVGAERLHVPERGLPHPAARRIVGEGPAIGRSVHGIEAAVRAASEGADHLVVGAIFRTASHPGVEPAGPGRLTAVRDAIAGPGQPPAIFAVGGIEPDRVADVRGAGADGVVALRALWEAPSPREAVDRYLAALEGPPR